MTNGEYWRLHNLTSNEVNNAIQSFYTHMEIHNLAHNDNRVLRRFNRNPEFWNIALHALQTSFFVILGRVFDEDDKSHSIYKLLRATEAHPEYFSKRALAERKRQETPGSEPDWLADYLAHAWEPDPKALKKLRRAIAPAIKKYKEVYKPIRHKIFAHKVLTDSVEVNALFDKALTKDIEKVLYDLHDLLECIWQLGYNGAEPKLGARKYDYKERIKNTTTSALIHVTGGHRKADGSLEEFLEGHAQADALSD
jgi:hypothetical protein